MKRLIFFIASSLLLNFASPANASVPKKIAADQKLGEYLSHGVVIGGQSGLGFSLLNIRRYFAAKSGIERLVLDLGDINGAPLLQKVSYFNVTIEKAPPRIVIDLERLKKSSINEKKLRQIFSKSAFIGNASITFDPEDLATTLVLPLKKEIEVEVFKMPTQDKASRIVLDLRLASAKKVAQ